MKITEETLSRLERVFKIQFYPWQKEYLIDDNWNNRPMGRHNGKTFAYMIKLLLSDGEKIKFSDIKHGKGCYVDGDYGGERYVSWFAGELLHLNDILQNAGFETRLDTKNN